ncbi:MAG: hypothetical protein RR198_01655 [Oscillospiraceae bacterium]
MEKSELKGKSFKVRRLFKQDVDLIENSFSYYDRLHFNPVTRQFILNVLLCGEFWGVFHNGKIVGATWLFKGEEEFFRTYNAKWEIEDLLNKDLKDCLICGYIWCDEEYKNQGIWQLCSRLWRMQGAKTEKKFMVHYTCAHCYCDFNSLFEDGFSLVGLRGLDNIVPHYIFTGKITFKAAPIYSTKRVERVPMEDTKQLSQLLEQGYKGVHLDKENNFCMIREESNDDKV